MKRAKKNYRKRQAWIWWPLSDGSLLLKSSFKFNVMRLTAYNPYENPYEDTK